MCLLALIRHVSNLPHDQATNGIELVFRQVGVELFIEFFYRCERFDGVSILIVFADVGIFFGIMFVVDFAYNFFQYVFDGDDTCYPAVLIHNDRHMIMVGAKLGQQHIQWLAFRCKYRASDQFCQIK